MQSVNDDGLHASTLCTRDPNRLRDLSVSTESDGNECSATAKPFSA